MTREKNFKELSEVLSAYLDGELTPDEMQQVEALLRKDESAQRLLSELRQTVQAVSGLPRRAAPDSILEELQLRLERNELLDDLPTGPIRRPRPRMRWGAILSMAAVLGVVVITGMWTLTDRSAELPSAVDTRLAQRSQEEAFLAERDTAIKPEQESPDRREVVAMGRRGAPRTIDEPDATPSMVARADREARPLRSATRGRRPVAPTDDATAFKPAAEPYDVDKKYTADAVHRDAGVMQLQLTVSSESERTVLLSRLTRRYTAYQTAPVLFANGSPYTEQGSETAQIALRLPLTEVDTLLSTVDGNNGVSEMALTAGPLTVRGKGRVQEVLALALSPMNNGALHQQDALSDDEVAQPHIPDQSRPDQQSWRELIRSLGLDPDTLALLLRPTNGETAIARRPDTQPDMDTVEPAPSALGDQAQTAPEDSLVARRLRAARQVEPASDPPPADEPTTATMTTATVDLVVEISVSDQTSRPNGSKPSYPTRARSIKPRDTDKNRPTAQ